MARTRTSYSSRGKHTYARPAGLERALQHIEDAKNLTIELGGTDVDVKEYFFLMPPALRDAILVEYGQRYGEAARSYAEETIPKWKNGSVKMSGTVAERLFNLLPPRMPIEKKYELTENLWQRLGPRVKRTITVGINVPIEKLIDLLNTTIQEDVISFQIPEQIERRFSWLSAGDVQIKQKLLNYMQDLEKESIITGARTQLPVILDHLRREGENTSLATQVLKLGNHEIRLEFDRDYDGVTMGSRRKVPPPTSKDSDYGWLIFLAIGVAVLVFLFN